MNVPQRNAIFKEIMKFNNDGVARLHENDITQALSSFQYATLQARMLLNVTETDQKDNHQSKYRNACSADQHHSTILSPSPAIRSNNQRYTTTSRIADYDHCYTDSRYYLNVRQNSSQQVMIDKTQNESMKQDINNHNHRNDDSTDICMEDESSSRAQVPMEGAENIPANLALCSPDKPLVGLQDDNYYIHDRPLVFHDDSIDHLSRMGIAVDMNEVYRGMIVITFNFALSCHLYAKHYGNTQSYHAAIDLYYLVWTISHNIAHHKKISLGNNDDNRMCEESIIEYQQNLMWHTTIQCMTLNNLVHVHDELNEFEESRVCMKCFSELVFWNTRQSLGATTTELSNNIDELEFLLDDDDDDYDDDDDDDDDDGIDSEYIVPDNDTRRKYNNNNSNRGRQEEGTVHSSSSTTSSSFFEIPEEWEQFLLNIIYFHSPETARAA